MNAAAIVNYTIFIFAIGACIGSFLNVVIWRLPHRGQIVKFCGKEGRLTLSWPPSHCPKCDVAIPWYLNIPVFAWVFLGGRCASCKAAIAIRYPLVELGTGLLFVGTFLAYFVGHWNPDITDFNRDWPVLILHELLIAALLACSAIDADWFIIPIELCWGVIALGLVAAALINSPGIPNISYPLAGGDNLGRFVAWPIACAGIGWAVAIILTLFKILPRSFEGMDATHDQMPAAEPKTASATSKSPAAAGASPSADAPLDPPPVLSRTKPSIITTVILVAILLGLVAAGQYTVASVLAPIFGVVIFLLGVLPRDPGGQDVTEEVVDEVHDPRSRSEMVKEMAFLAFPSMGFVIGTFLPQVLPAAPWMQRGLGALGGALTAAAVLWLIRIAFTFVTGKQGMGLGDISLLACIGAVLGTKLALLTFFVFAPLTGLAWAIILISLKRPNVLPYGPWLSVGAILSMFLGDPLIQWYIRTFL